MYYSQMSVNQLKALKAELENEYKLLKEQKLSLDLSRGKPGQAQLDLMTGMLDCISTAEDS